MPTDRYTKAVLTVIATCLVYLSLVATPWPAVAAAADPLEVVIVGFHETTPSSATNLREGLPVRVVGGR